MYLKGPDLQTVPGRYRGAFVPLREDDVFVSVDISASQPTVFANLTGAPGLTTISLFGYEELATRLFPAAEARTRTKGALIAVLNGGGHHAMHRYLNDSKAERAMRVWLEEECTGFQRLRDLAEASWAAASDGESIELEVPSGFRASVVKPHGKALGTLLSAVYTQKEAQILDELLLHLPRGCQLAIPSFDGLVVACPRDEASRVVQELGRAMLEAAYKCDVQLRCKVGVGETWGAAEDSATIFAPSL